MNKNITAIILIVLAAGIYFTVTEDMIAKAKQVKSVNDQYVSAIKGAEQLIKVRDKVLKDYNDISIDDREKLDKMVPNTVDNIRLIIDLNTIAMQHGFSLRNIKATTGQKTPANTAPTAAARAAEANMLGGIPTEDKGISTPVLDTVTVTFSVTAPYQKFISFLQDIESNLRLMDVTKFTLSSSDSGVYDFNVELKTYWLRQQ